MSSNECGRIQKRVTDYISNRRGSSSVYRVQYNTLRSFKLRTYPRWGRPLYTRFVSKLNVLLTIHTGSYAITKSNGHLCNTMYTPEERENRKQVTQEERENRKQVLETKLAISWDRSKEANGSVDIRRSRHPYNRISVIYAARPTASWGSECNRSCYIGTRYWFITARIVSRLDTGS